MSLSSRVLSFLKESSPVSYVREKVEERAGGFNMPTVRDTSQRVLSFLKQYPSPTSYLKKKVFQPIRKHKIETGKPFLPELAPKRFIGDTEKKLDLITNTILGLPEATIQTLPFVRLLRQPRPKTIKGRVKTLGIETKDFIRGLGQLAVRPGISVVWRR